MSSKMLCLPGRTATKTGPEDATYPPWVDVLGAAFRLENTVIR